MSETEIPPLPARRNATNHTRNLPYSQPTNYTPTTRPYRRPLSQQEMPNKKRKVASPVPGTTIPSIFPFSFGRSHPLPPNQTDTCDDSFHNILFTTLKKILSEVKSYELANIDITYVKNIYKNSHLENEPTNDLDEY
nr:unnamed protein product [Callosobruchus analis]